MICTLPEAEIFPRVSELRSAIVIVEPLTDNESKLFNELSSIISPSLESLVVPLVVICELGDCVILPFITCIVRSLEESEPIYNEF